MPLLQPLLVLRHVALRELLVGKHGGEEILRLRRHQAEARHLGGGGDDHVVVGIYGAHSETRETQIFGQAVHNVNPVPKWSVDVVPGDQNLHDAEEAGRVKNSAGVDFVADEMDGFGVGEIDEEVELAAGEGDPQRVGGISD